MCSQYLCHTLMFKATLKPSAFLLVNMVDSCDKLTLIVSVVISEALLTRYDCRDRDGLSLALTGMSCFCVSRV